MQFLVCLTMMSMTEAKTESDTERWNMEVVMMTMNSMYVGLDYALHFRCYECSSSIDDDLDGSCVGTDA